MQTQIHFCDLCNESVPQNDLDQGRAFLRKGRVVCAKCDALMSPEKHEPAPAATLVGEPAPPPPPPAVPAAPAGSHLPRAARGRERTALGIALVAVVLVVVLGYWVGDQLDRVRSDSEAGVATVANSAAEARRAAERVSDDARRDIEAAEERARQSLEAQRVRVEAAGAEQRQLAANVAARIEGLAREIAAMRETFGQVSRHDSELVALQQRYSALEEELDSLKGEVDRRIAEAAAAVPPPTVEPPAPARPAWIGLVDGLASANPSERWNAIHALGETRDPAAAEYVAPALKDVDIFIRMTAARVLGDLASPVSIEPLIGALEDGEGAVREAAYDALKKVTGRNLPFDPQSADAGERAKQVRAWQDWWKKEREKLGS